MLRRGFGLVVVLAALLLVPAWASGASFYVDCGAGAGGDGSLATPWDAVADVNAASFSAGDSVLFKRGCTWRETLTVPSNGSAGSPITFGAYGTGANPIISGANVLTGFTQSTSASVAESTTGGNADWNHRNDVTNVYLAQGFEADTTGISVPYIDIPLKKTGSPTGNIWMEIWTTTGTPARYSSVHATSANIDVSTLTGSYATKRFTFSPSVSITADTIYVMTLAGDYTNNGTDYAVWQLKTGDSYRGGDPFRLHRYEAGRTYNSGFDHDFIFAVYKEVTGTVYQKTGVTTEPKQVFYNGTILTPEPGATTAVALNKWDWNANTLYVNVGADPDAGTLEASQRDRVMIVWKDHVTVSGLTLKNANSDNLNVIGQHNTISGCDISYAASKGLIWGTTSGAAVVEGNDIHHNGLGRSDVYGAGIWTWHDTGSVGHENYIRNNNVYSNTNYGIYIVSSYWIVENNNVYDTGNLTEGANGIEFFDGDNAGWSQHNVARYNTVWGTISGLNDGTGIAADDYSAYTDIYYNICYGNDGAGIGVYKAGNVNVYNNVLYNNSQNVGGARTVFSEINVMADADGLNSNVVIKNNIALATEANTYAVYLDSHAYKASGLSITNNVWSASAANWYFWNASGGSTLATWNALTGVGTDLNADPLFVGAPDFRLQPGSPAINAGVGVGLTTDYAGQAISGLPDIGAYEFQGGAVGLSHVGPSSPPRAPSGAGVHTAPPETSIPPSTPGTTCPCYTAASIQASLDTCANETTSCDPGVAGPTLTFRAVCVGPPLAILAKWAQLTDAGECSKTTPDPVTGESIVATETVNGTQRADCTAILVAKCP